MKTKFSATGRSLHVDQLLTNMALGYKPRQGIADQVFPMVQVQKQSDDYIVFDSDDILRVENSLRSPGKEANIIEQSVSEQPFYCRNRALKMALTIEDKVNSDPIFVQTLINGRAQFIMDKLALDWEKRVADLVTSTANVPNNSTVTVGWGAIDTADVMEDIWAGLFAAEDAKGYRPNSIAIGATAWRNMRRNTALRDLIHGNNNGGGNATMEQVKTLFGLERFVVGESFINTANEAQAESLERVWSDDVLIYYAPMSPMMNVPSFGYSFRWAAPGLANMTAERHPYDTRKKSEEVELGYYQDERITGNQYAFLLKDVNTSNP